MVLIAGRTEGNAVPGRLAVKTGPGLLTDAVNVTTGPDGVPVAEPPNFGGAITAHSAVKAGTPIVAVRPNANPAPGAAAPEPVAFAASDAAKATTITDHGIVGDLFTVVPQLIEKNSKRRGS